MLVNDSVNRNLEIVAMVSETSFAELCLENVIFATGNTLLILYQLLQESRHFSSMNLSTTLCSSLLGLWPLEYILQIVNDFKSDSLQPWIS